MADVDRILERLARTRPALIAEARTFSTADFARSPAPGRWSAAHVLDHLAVMEGRLAPHFRAMVEGTKPTTVGLWDRVRCLPPSLVLWRGVRVPNPKIVDPAKEPASCDELVAKLTSSRTQLVTLIEETRGRDLGRLRLVHGFLGGLNLYGWWELIAHHEERHRHQLIEIRQALTAAP